MSRESESSVKDLVVALEAQTKALTAMAQAITLMAQAMVSEDADGMGPQYLDGSDAG